MVDAGLCYIPDDEFQDATTCPYCEIEIVGWEKGDDPLYLMIKIRKEHHDQAENCPFFSLKREYEQLKKPVVVSEKANLVVIESSEEELVAIVSQPKPKTYKSARRAKATQAKTEDIVKEDMKKPRVESSKETAATKKIKKSSDNANVSLMDSSNSAILENEIAVPATRKGGKREGKQAHEEITTSNPKATASIVEKGAGSRVVRVKKVKSEPIVEELVEEAIISEGTITRNKEIKVKHVAKSAATQKTVITDPQRETSNLKEKDIAKATGKKNIQEEADKSSKRDAPKNIDKTTNKRQAVESRAGDKAKPIVVDDDDVQEEPKKATRKTRQKNEKAEPKSPIKKSRPSPKSKKKAIDISPRKSTEVFPDEYSQNSALDKELGNDIISEKTADVERNGFGSSNQKQVIKDTMDMAISNLIKAPSSGVDEVQEEPKKVARKTRQKIEKAPKNVEIPMPKSPIKASRQSPKSKKIPVEISPVKSTVVFPNEDDQKLALGEDVKKSSFSNDTTKLQSKNDQVIKASMELAISNFIDAPASDKNPKSTTILT